jgi:hypothetical protein
MSERLIHNVPHRSPILAAKNYVLLRPLHLTIDMGYYNSVEAMAKRQLKVGTVPNKSKNLLVETDRSVKSEAKNDCAI